MGDKATVIPVILVVVFDFQEAIHSLIKIWTPCTTLDIMYVANVASRPLTFLESRDFVTWN